MLASGQSIVTITRWRKETVEITDLIAQGKAKDFYTTSTKELFPGRTEWMCTS